MTSHPSPFDLNRYLTYLVGVSGGCDSMVLIDMLVKSGFKKLIVCHLNHGLRGQASANDLRFVRSYAKKIGLPFYSAKADTTRFAKDSKSSIETAARELRFTFFAQCAKKSRCKRLILAHHGDDQIETVLLHFLRGSGMRGLGGMREKSTQKLLGICLQIFRPLLNLSQMEIQDYAKQNRIAWRDDASNQSCTHTRNRIRHDVIPLLETVSGRNLRPTLLRLAQLLQAEDDWICSLIPEVDAQLSCRQLSDYPLALQRRVVRKWLLEQNIHEPDFNDVEAVLSLLNIEKGPAKINLPKGRFARRRCGLIFIE